MNIDVDLVREKANPEEQQLHAMKQNGELYQWKENYKKEELPEYYELSKKGRLPEIFYHICSHMNIDIGKDEGFVYFIDYIYLLDEVRGYQFGNLTPDYRTFLQHGLKGLKIKDTGSRYSDDYNNTVTAIGMLIDRIIAALREQETNNKDTKIKWFENMKNSGADHFAEGLQRILFVNQVIWQTDHRLIGIGLLDDYLCDLYEKDINSDFISEQDAETALEDFLKALHEYYWLKSNMLMGDTGQIIVLGKSGENGEYLYSRLTMLILRTIKKLALPDPKVLLRVNKNAPAEVLNLAVETTATGIGSPLLSNDEVIIPKLIQFGIPKEDALNYTVAACWEPLVGGKSSSLNNMTTLNFMRSMENLFKRDRLSEITNFSELIDRYEFYLAKNINAVKRVIDGGKFQYDTVMSVFLDGCKEKDASMGGATYLNAGITTVAMGNVVNSLLNIKKYVFEEKQYSLFDVKRILLTNFDGDDELLHELRSEKKYYGTDDERVIELTRKIVGMVSKYTEGYRTPYGGRLKFGMSAPTYIDAAIGSLASFDGRKAGEPYQVHISNDGAASYTEVINFASALDYDGNRFNGNVVDLMINPTFMMENEEKFRCLIIGAITQGFFQMQANVVSSAILIDAVKHPENHKDLIVRVWGFSAYFSDLPDTYKQVLIHRALVNEGKLAA